MAARTMRYISLFSGIEAASVAWEPLGWEPVAFAEIEPFPCAVLEERYPTVPNLGDVTKVDWSDYRGKADLIIGGSPCQSFSIAGLRKGLADPRGNLMLEYLRACYEVDPEWIVWENVPGVLSADERRAFQTFLEAVVELWPRGGACWRVLDAQFFGVAQRRRRVFAVVNTRDWRRAAAVLLEPDCMRGNNPSSRTKRQELARAVELGASHTLAFDTTNVTSPANGSKPVWDEACHTLASGAHAPAVCIQGSMIGRSETAGPRGNGFNEEVAFTLNTTDRHVVCMQSAHANAAVDDDLSGTLCARGGTPPIVVIEHA